MSDVIGIAFRLHIVQCMQVVAATLLVTDWALLFDQEVRHIWGSGWALTKCIYLLSRYLPFIDTTLNLMYFMDRDISPPTCQWMYIVSTWLMSLGIGLTELLLVIRTYAIYDRSKRVLYILTVIWIGWIAANLPIIHLFTKSLRHGPMPHPDIPGCYATAGSPIVFASFASLLVFELLIVIMTVRKAITHFRRRVSFGQNNLLSVLYRDGIIFFTILATCTLGNVMVLLFGEPEYYNLLDAFTRVIHSLLCCRVLINLKEANAKKAIISVSVDSAASTVSPDTQTHIPIAFNPRPADSEPRTETPSTRAFRVSATPTIRCPELEGIGALDIALETKLSAPHGLSVLSSSG